MTNSVTTPGYWPTTVDTVAEISAAYPFEREVDGHHSYVTFVSDEDVLRRARALADDAGPGEKIDPATA